MTASGNQQDAPLRAEIQFFMDKVFQISLAYFASLIAILAISKSTFADQLAASVEMTEGFIAVTVLMLNVLYLILATACLFAVLKRGLFALQLNSMASSTWVSWERFLRDERNFRLKNRRLAGIMWNIDNWYVAPIYVAVFAISVVALINAIRSGTPAAVVVATIFASLHVIPAFMLVSIARLDSRCRERAGLL